MQATALKLPENLHEDELFWMPGTWDDYLEILDEADQTAPTLTIQFLNNEIIMSQASAPHEELVMTIGWLLKTALLSQRQYRVLGSSIKIMIPDHDGDFNADVSVVKAPIEYGTTPAGKLTNMRIANPEIVVEVLSKSTRKFDEIEKSAYYKRISSLQHILLVDQYKPYASVFSRTETPGQWLNQDYWSLDDVVRLGGIELPMRDIYNDILSE
ncbi:MAG: Uma2 family endonuclease [Cytophagales bacterium]|nr:MAG: Uma2 family endonuclease [Cytophagales bacterium]